MNCCTNALHCKNAKELSSNWNIISLVRVSIFIPFKSIIFLIHKKKNLNSKFRGLWATNVYLRWKCVLLLLHGVSKFNWVLLLPLRVLLSSYHPALLLSCIQCFFICFFELHKVAPISICTIHVLKYLST